MLPCRVLESDRFSNDLIGGGRALRGSHACGWAASREAITHAMQRSDHGKQREAAADALS